MYIDIAPDNTESGRNCDKDDIVHVKHERLLRNRVVSMISKALRLAAAVHDQQVDKGGTPYILHPIAVANMMEIEEQKIVPLLYDVVEDSSVTFEMLTSYGFSYRVLRATKTITRHKGEDYKAYIARVKQDVLACKVKAADLKHNMDLSRTFEPCKEDYLRIERYRSVLKQLSTP